MVQDMHPYVQVEGSSTTWYRTHASAAVCGFLVAGVVVALGRIAPNEIQSRTSGTDSFDLVALSSPTMQSMRLRPSFDKFQPIYGRHGRVQHLQPCLAEPNMVAWPIPPGPPGPKTKGAVATPEELAVKDPTLYVYDHCPFCVRARMVFGIKSIPFNLYFLQNDDVKTPTRLVGRKITPILEDPANSIIMPESLDIVKYMDKDNSLQPESGREDLKALFKSLGDVRSKLTRPRVGQSLMPEFGSRKAATVWVNNHQIKDGTTYEEAFAKTPEYIAVVEEALLKLEGLIASPEHISPGGVGYDDILYFPLLRSITIVKGINWPPKVLAYCETMSAKADVPMLWQLAF